MSTRTALPADPSSQTGALDTSSLNPADPSTRTAVLGEPLPESVNSMAPTQIDGADVNEPIRKLQAYQGELLQLSEGIRQRLATIQETAPRYLQDIQTQIQPKADALMDAVKDTSEVEIPRGVVLRTFSFGAVMLAAAAFGSIASGYLLAPVLSIFLGRFAAGLLALVAVPIYSYTTIKKLHDGGAAPNELNNALLLVSAGHGALVGYALSYSYVYASPLLPLTSLIVSVALPLALPTIGNHRPSVLAVGLGASLLAHFLLGAVFGPFSLAYITLAGLYTAVAGVVLQFIIKEPTLPLWTYQLGLVGATLAVKLAFFAVFSSDHAVSP
ncbi:unnamed protein product [Caenorhabditis auriculariae]|uniref:Uncharacterized protein n=1 Tax=Caenorhabditis auriculariae TaxID=2777116 RepID=A0A8S1HPA6_9PELO|nr:unnamed protein product [Caenorhabditis auriculariae]